MKMTLYESFLATVLALTATQVACSDGAVPPSDLPLPAGEFSPGDEPVYLSIPITAQQVEGVWTFYHSQAGGDAAAYGGRAAIVDGCLTVGGAIMVWRSDQAEAVRELVSEVRAGRSPLVSVGGSEVGPPLAITERCNTNSAWSVSKGFEVLTK